MSNDKHPEPLSFTCVECRSHVTQSFESVCNVCYQSGQPLCTACRRGNRHTCPACTYSMCAEHAKCVDSNMYCFNGKYITCPIEVSTKKRKQQEATDIEVSTKKRNQQEATDIEVSTKKRNQQDATE